MNAARKQGAGGPPPWHLWGNTQQITTTFQTTTAPSFLTPGNLVRLAYHRPETWHWFLSATLIDGPNATVAEFAQVEVQFDLTIGIGRSAIRIPVQPDNLFTARPTFEQYFFTWGGGASVLFPRNVQIYTTEVLAPNRSLRTNPPFPDQTGNAAAGSESASVIRQIVAQDIQMNCRVRALTLPAAPFLGAPVTVEVSAQFSPKTHVRPDWFEQDYEGGALGGR